MKESREELCREILQLVADVEFLRAVAARLRARGYPSLAWAVTPWIRMNHGFIARRAHQVGMTGLPLTADVAAFARAQLGLPIDAPATSRPPRRDATQWARDLELMAEATAA